MENSNFKKQAKSDIFKELHPIISFYINKGAKPKSLKKYYKNTKRFNDLLDDIKNKGVNLVKEDEYKSLVKEILDEILDDFIASDKDKEYNKKQETKMKHIKEFNSYKPVNEDTFYETMLGIGMGIFFYKFLNGLVKDVISNYKDKKEMERYIKMSPKEKEEYENDLHSRHITAKFKSLNGFVREFVKKGGKIKFTEDYVNYIFELGDLTIKINKFEKTMRWNKIDFAGIASNYVIKDKENFDEPMKISQEDIDKLIGGIKEDENNQE
jgi:hypothetical protein